MNILETEFHLHWGGQPAVVLLLAQKMAEAGHTLTIAAPPGSEMERRARELGIAVFTECHFQRGFRPAAFQRDLRALGRCLREREIDIVHVHGSQDSWLAGLANRWLGGRAKIVKTKHSTLPVKNHLANRWLYKTLCAHCTVVAGALRPQLLGLVPEERVSVIHAPIADHFFQADAPPLDLRGELGLPPKTPLIGHVARLSNPKGQDVVIDAAPHILAAHPQAKILFIGTGEEYHRLQDRIAAAGLKDSVFLLGFREDIISLLRNLDVVLLPSVSGEGSPVSLKEAMSQNVPVVATPLAGVPEIITTGENGILVEPNNPTALAEAVVDLLTDSEKAGRIAAVGKKIVQERYSGEVVAAAFLEIFSRLQQEPVAKKTRS